MLDVLDPGIVRMSTGLAISKIPGLLAHVTRSKFVETVVIDVYISFFFLSTRAFPHYPHSRGSALWRSCRFQSQGGWNGEHPNPQWQSDRLQSPQSPQSLRGE